MADEKLVEDLAEHLRAQCPTEDQCVTDEDECFRAHPIHTAFARDDRIEIVYAEVDALSRVALGWLAERGRLVPDRPGEVVEDCGCPITYKVAKVESHTYECGQRQAVQRMAHYIAEEYGDG